MRSASARYFCLHRRISFPNLPIQSLHSSSFQAFLNVRGTSPDKFPSISVWTSHRSLLATMAGKGHHENRLAREKSPYLLQHKNNPVDWYPWGEEAFQKARNEGKIIFLSIGYSTCHWCHVMERESFENAEIAKILNDNFVSIKVDREERPDVDRMYMTFVQATQGSGGWPLTVFLTPDLKPIAGGTYFPPHDQFGRPGFGTVLKNLAQTWRNKKREVEQQSSAIMEAMQSAINASAAESPGIPTRVSVEKCYKSISRSFDERYGGFEGAPKFPQPVNLNFLLRASLVLGGVEKQECLRMCFKTLTAMADGGIYDHIGFGFHRYSTDERWHVPHFEKMLYDNAQLLTSYAEAFQVSKTEEFERIARQIIRYIMRDMTDPSGGIYSAEDADSLSNPQAKHKTEGAFYAWTASEIDSALKGHKTGHGEKAAYSDVFKSRFGVKTNGNVDPRGDPHGELKGTNVLMVMESWEATATKFGLSIAETKGIIETCREILFGIREHRPRPHLDDKMIAAWNGLMLSGLSKAAQAFQDEEIKAKALSVGHFLKDHLWDAKRGVLLHSVYKGTSGPIQIAKPIDGFCEDYVCVIRGLLDLYETCFDPSFLEWAHVLQLKQDELFWDSANGGYFSSAKDDPHLLLRMKEETDGAEPSPNSVAAGNLLRLSLMLDKPEWEEKALKIFQAFHERLEKIPRAVPELISALMFHLQKPQQVAVNGELEDSRTRDFIKSVQTSFSPFKTVMLMDKKNMGALKGIVKDFVEMPSSAAGKGGPTAHVCRDKVCSAAVHNASDLLQELHQAG